MLSDRRLRELEWAAEFMRANTKRRGCRCAGTCPACVQWAHQAARVSPGTALELIGEVRRLQAERDKFRALLSAASRHITCNYEPSCCGRIQDEAARALSEMSS